MDQKISVPATATAVFTKVTSEMNVHHTQHLVLLNTVLFCSGQAVQNAAIYDSLAVIREGSLET